MAGTVVTIEESVDLAAPLERVWALVSSSQGLSRWFVDATVVPGISGSVTLRFAPGAEGTMPIQIWEPPYRFRFGAAEGEPGRAHEIRLIEGRLGDTQVRLIDVGLSDAELEPTRMSWRSMLIKLKSLAEKGSPL